MNGLETIKGTDLTKEQKELLKWNGMSKPEWVNNHSFHFIYGLPASEDSGFYYPICHSFSHLPS